MSSYNGNGNGNGSARRGNGRGSANGSAARGGDMSTIGDRLPPQNLEAERKVLGGVLLDNDMLHEIVQILKPDDFYRDAHQTIYRAICDLYDQGKAVDAVTLADELIRRDQFESAGGDDTLEEILNSVPHAANSVYHAEIVREKAVSRRLIEGATEIIRDGYSNRMTAKELLEVAENKIFQIAEDQIKGDTHEIKEIVTQAMEQISLRAEGRHEVHGVATGFYDVDEMLGGFQPGQLIIIAARPSMGKTAFALNICDHAAVKNNIATLFVSLEMGRVELAERLLGARARVDGNRLRHGHNLATSDLTRLGKAYNEFSQAPLFIDDTPARDVLQITASARRLKMRNNLGMIVLDYIQLVDSEDSRDSRQEQIAKISRRLKALARSLKVPVLALSQLNRAVENREDRRPRMADLRESGAIEQDADMVLLLHRPEYYDPNDQPGVAEVIIAKNRNGPTGTAKLTFLKNITQFENIANMIEPIDDGSSQPF